MGASALLVRIPAIICVIEVEHRSVIVDIIFDAIGTFIPAIATMPRSFEVVNVRTLFRAKLDLIDDFIPFSSQVGSRSQEPSNAIVKTYFIF